MSPYKKFYASVFIALLVACTVASGQTGFGPPQGGGGGGGVANPLTATLNGGGFSLENFGEAQVAGAVYCDSLDAQSGSAIAVNTNLTFSESALLRFGGSTSDYPAAKYGGTSGRIDLTRADGSDGSIVVRNGGNNQNLQFEAQGTGVLTFSTGTGRQVFDYNGDEVAVVGSRGLSVNTTGYALQLVDQGSPPTVTAGYVGAFASNRSGYQSPAWKGDFGTVRLGPDGIGSRIRLTRTSDQTITDNTATDIIWTTENIDDSGRCALGTYNTRIVTAIEDESWQFTVNVHLSASCTLDLGQTVRLRHYNSGGSEASGAAVDIAQAGTAAPTVQSVSATFHLAAGDYIVATFYRDDVANASVDVYGSASPTLTWVSGTRVR